MYICNVCMSVCMYIHMCMYMYVHVCMSVCICGNSFTHMYIQCMYIHVCVCVCLFLRLLVIYTVSLRHENMISILYQLKHVCVCS